MHSYETEGAPSYLRFHYEVYNHIQVKTSILRFVTYAGIQFLATNIFKSKSLLVEK